MNDIYTIYKVALQDISQDSFEHFVFLFEKERNIRIDGKRTTYRDAIEDLIWQIDSQTDIGALDVFDENPIKVYEDEQTFSYDAVFSCPYPYKTAKYWIYCFIVTYTSTTRQDCLQFAAKQPAFYNKRWKAKRAVDNVVHDLQQNPHFISKKGEYQFNAD